MPRDLSESLAGLRKSRPRAVALEDARPVTFQAPADGDLHLLARPGVEGVDLGGWARQNRDEVARRLAETGAVLFRGFPIATPEDFEATCAGFSDDLMDYGERSTPRSEVQGKVYTSTEYPPDQHIPLHNEMSYAATWPRRIFFCCLTPAEEGGRTPLADSHRVWRDVDPEVRGRFEEKGVMYVRNFGEVLGLPWREVFQRDSRREVEEYCRGAGIEVEWGDGDRLRTRAVRPAVLEHPTRGVKVWFNQAHLHHVSALPDDARESLLEVVSEDELPFNTFYGDGTPIGDGDLAEVRRALDGATRSFDWRRGDLLLLDNELIAHGRSTYRGDRRVVVAMSGS